MKSLFLSGNSDTCDLLLLFLLTNLVVIQINKTNTAKRRIKEINIG